MLLLYNYKQVQTFSEYGLFHLNIKFIQAIVDSVQLKFYKY